jgi:hypothetical protein
MSVGLAGHPVLDVSYDLQKKDFLA